MHSQMAWGSFAAQALPAEHPRTVIAAQAALAGALARRGRWTKLDLLAAALTVTSWAGLMSVHRQAQRAPAVLERALADVLGADYRARMVLPRMPEPGAPEPTDPSLLRILRVRRRYCHDADLSYGPFGQANLLDVWRRPDLDPKAAAPVLFQIPGGAWVMGNKQGQAYPLLAHLVERGWICVAISYRHAPRDRWPATIVDVKRALAWVKENIAAYGGNPNFVAITGGSAGGHLTALTALSAGDPAFQPGFEDADTAVQAAVPFYGVYDWTGGPGSEPLLQEFLERWVVTDRYRDLPDLYVNASPFHRITSTAPPIFVVHGDRDNLVPVTQTRPFVEELRRQSSAPVAYAELPGAPHGFDIINSLRALASVHAVGRFLATVYGDHLGFPEPSATVHRPGKR